MELEIDLRKIGKTFKEKYQNFRQLIRENPREFLKFEIGLLIGLLIWVIGLLIWVMLNSAIGISAFLIGIPSAIIVVFLLFMLRLLGLEDLAMDFWDKLIVTYEKGETAENSFELIPPIVEWVPTIIELSTELSKSLTHLGRAIFENFAILFPVLLDIQIDVDWLHISFAFLVRTFFNIVQFAIMYYIFRKIKHRIKRKINEEVESLKSSKG